MALWGIWGDNWQIKELQWGTKVDPRPEYVILLAYYVG